MFLLRACEAELSRGSDVSAVVRVRALCFLLPHARVRDERPECILVSGQEMGGSHGNQPRLLDIGTLWAAL